MIRVLLLGGGVLQNRLTGIFRAHGYEVFVIDRNPDAPGFQNANGYRVLDFVNPDKVILYGREIKPDLILGVNEIGVWVASQASEVLDLPNIPTDIAWNCLHKGEMRNRWSDARLTQPDYFITKNLKDGVGTAIDSFGFPLVIKPAFGWGSKGTSLAWNEADLQRAIQFANKYSLVGEFIIERFIDGTEITIEGLVKDGNVSVLAISDKILQSHDHYRVAMSLIYPPRLNDMIVENIRMSATLAVKATGLQNGAFHAEAMVSKEGIFMLELGARGGGGHIFSTIVEAVSGVCMPVELVKILMNDPTAKIDPTRQHSCIYQFFNAPPGVFQRIEGLLEAKTIPGVLDIGFSMNPGTISKPIENDTLRPGFLVVHGKDHKESFSVLQSVYDKLQFTVKLPVPEII